MTEEELEGVFSLRRSKERYFMYSMNLYILPVKAEKANVIDRKRWIRKPVLPE